MDETAGGLGRRVLAWVIIIAVAVIALKVAFGIVFGLFQALISIALLVVVVMGVLWALRHI
jgi:divalent metal cation (Fe/Co/Zn/Cd) transporter